MIQLVVGAIILSVLACSVILFVKRKKTDFSTGYDKYTVGHNKSQLMFVCACDRGANVQSWENTLPSPGEYN